MWFTQMLENSEMSQTESREKYGIKTVISKNYISLKKAQAWVDIDEDTELICGTNTMPLTDMVDAYMFGWMIIQLHITGYSQIIAKYLRFSQDIPYRTFYDHLMQKIKNSDFFGPHHDMMHDMVTDFLNSGEVRNESSGHMLHATSGAWLYENKTLIMKFIFDAASELSQMPDWVGDLQQNFVYDSEIKYPVTITADYDILSEKISEVTYVVNPNVAEKISNLSLASVRRKGLLKNRITAH
jgi:hypothetical protein